MFTLENIVALDACLDPRSIKCTLSLLCLVKGDQDLNHIGLLVFAQSLKMAAKSDLKSLNKASLPFLQSGRILLEVLLGEISSHELSCAEQLQRLLDLTLSGVEFFFESLEGAALVKVRLHLE